LSWCTDLHALFERGDSNLEELVEVGAGDAEKPQTFKQGYVRVLRLGQYALAELKHAQFAIDVTISG
jgi:hypothetical protein